MKALFTLRPLLTVVGVILLALFIWFAGPLFAFGPYRPLAPELTRIILIVLVILGMVIAKVVTRLRANQKSDNLIAAVVQQSATDTKQTAEAQQLRERFEEAVATLKQQRKSGHSLYDLPWYVIIGAPGSGKTTALVNSGLKFPIEQRSGKAALRGVGGTRNCDWWFTDQAVLLDTAGRYTTQDSDASADSAAWSAFLGLLRKYRGRRPINGVILTISAQDLMVQDTNARETHVNAARRRLDELNRELRMQLPVYVMVTKCDLVAGFTEYFDDQPQQGRAQVWGVTFPYEDTAKGAAAQQFPAEFDAIIARLNERLMPRLEEERDVRRRARVFGFPQQMAALREPLSGFVSDVFASTRFDKALLLRGVYFTSGTQEGTPIDRLLGALGRQFAVAESMITPGGRGKAYFIERLLMDVMFAESGLAGVNRRVEVRKGILQLAAYVLMTLIGVAGVIVFTASYRGNRAYIAEVEGDVSKLAQSAPPGSSASLETRLPRLDAIRAVNASANRYTASGAPFSMRWGLFQGDALGAAARDAYVRELNDTFLSQVTARFRQRLIDYAGEPEKLYEYLKGYLMLGDPDHFNADQLRYLADQEWEQAYGATPPVRDSVAGHFNALLESGKIRRQNLDDTVIAQARNTLGQSSKAGLVYRYLKIQYARDTARALRLDQEAGLGADRVLRRKSRISLAMPLPSLYTKDVFNEIVATGTGDLVKQFSEEGWVWGSSAPALASSAGLTTELLNVYEKDYITFWDGIVHDIEPVPLGGLQNTKQAVAILAGPASPLRGLLKAIDKHTYLIAPKEAPAAPSSVSRLRDVFNNAAGRAGIAAAPTTAAGAQVTMYFADIHRLVSAEGGAPPIDNILRTLGQIQEKMAPLGEAVGEKAPDPGSQREITELANALKRDAAPLPPSVAAVVSAIADGTRGAVVSNSVSTVANTYQARVLNECRTLANGRYPFTAGSTNDIPLADFERLFGLGGVFDTYFRSDLEPYVNTTRSPWSWREGAAGGNVPLAQFEAVERIRQNFFRSSKAEARFTVTADGLDRDSVSFTLNLDGQEVRNRHDAPRAWQMSWPGPKPGIATATFEPAGGPNFVSEGPWAMFRLIESGQLTRESDVRYLLTLKKGAREIQLRFEADSVRNPFGKLDILQRFRCE